MCSAGETCSAPLHLRLGSYSLQCCIMQTWPSARHCKLRQALRGGIHNIDSTVGSSGSSLPALLTGLVISASAVMAPRERHHACSVHHCHHARHQLCTAAGHHGPHIIMPHSAQPPLPQLTSGCAHVPRVLQLPQSQMIILPSMLPDAARGRCLLKPADSMLSSWPAAGKASRTSARQASITQLPVACITHWSHGQVAHC